MLEIMGKCSSYGEGTADLAGTVNARLRAWRGRCRVGAGRKA